MQIKNVIISILIGYTATTLPIWVTREGIWFLGFLIALFSMDMLINIDDWQHKRKKRHRNGSSGSAIKKLNFK